VSTRALPAQSGEDTRLADQRLRVVSRHAHQGRHAVEETEQRLYMLSAGGSPFYTPRKRAALTWAEVVALIADEEVSDELYKEADDTFQRIILST